VSAALDGLTIVVTRPAAQAAPFMDLATQAGARCIPFPTLEIERILPPAGTLDEVARTRWDWAIYTSTNAVEAASDALGGQLPTAHRSAAVGRATTRALERRGAEVALRPQTADSEGLLASPDLLAVAGAHVLLIKGVGGRDVLRETLASRGAHVRELEVYRRRRCEPTHEARAQLQAALIDREARCVVAVTSAEVLEALLQLVDAADAERLRSRPLLLPGPRVAATARRLGWSGPLVQAATAEDDAMLRAVEQFAATRPASPP
jgi:uroporphyrinogen-III synthase